MIAGAVGGCQAECGTAIAMAAAAGVEVCGGTTAQMDDALALGLKNVLGLVCDPIGGLVEVPCVKRNAFHAVHTLVAIELALAGVHSVVPGDEVIAAMAQIGRMMPKSLRERSEAGLATTPTGVGMPVKYRAKKRRVRRRKNVRILERWRKSSRIALPTAVRELLTILSAAGFEAYAVGGCVRDTWIGRIPHDWDITTAARPDEIVAVLTAAGAEVIPQIGDAFAVSLVRWRGGMYEIATFRGETYGADSHRPETVYYADSLAEDLARRDFTVNAMAADADGRICDPYDGRRDLRRRRLMTVGRPDERFNEDALRLFRACRFTAQLDLLPARELCAAMPAAFDRVRGCR